MKLKYGILAKARKSSTGQTFTEYSIILLFVGRRSLFRVRGIGSRSQKLCGQRRYVHRHGSGGSLGGT